MEFLTPMQTIVLLSFAIPFLFIIIFVSVYAAHLKSDNSYLRKCLSDNNKAMSSERQIHKETAEALKIVRENLRKANLKIVSRPDPKDLTISKSPIKILKFTLKEFESETVLSKATGLKKLHETVGEMVLRAAKETKTRVLYTGADYETEFEIAIADLKEKS